MQGLGWYKTFEGECSKSFELLERSNCPAPLASSTFMIGWFPYSIFLAFKIAG